jgi:hypothetical protein
MPNNNKSTLPEGLDISKVLAELEVPFPPDQVHWRVMNTSQEKKRGQIAPYADPRAYIDRLNALFSPQGWTRNYRIETMNNITRVKKGETIVTGKVLVTCTVTIIGLWSHSGTGEEWADDDNGMTSADAQAFKRACACFGLGRYFYDFIPVWIDLDQNRQPKKVPLLPAWAVPENWRKGKRPAGKNGNGIGPVNGVSGNAHSSEKANQTREQRNSSCPCEQDTRIAALEKVVGPTLYRGVLHQHGKAEHPANIHDPLAKRRVFEILESAARGLDRLNAIKRRVDSKMLESLLDKIQAPPLTEIRDMKTLRNVVLGLEQLVDSPPIQHG